MLLQRPCKKRLPKRCACASARARGNNKDVMHPEKVISRCFRTGVRLPSPPPKRQALRQWRRACLLVEILIKGESNAEKKQPKWLFLNGDRRILRSITKDKIRNASQNSRTTPLASTRTSKSELFRYDGTVRICFLL